MRLITYLNADRRPALAVRHQSDIIALPGDAPRDLLALIQEGGDAFSRVQGMVKKGNLLDPKAITYLPPLLRPGKILCIGLNYADHTKESPYEQPSYPTIFTRFATTLVGHSQPVLRPLCSVQLDYEGELVAFVGKGGRHISRERALEHIVGYSVFNDVSVRDYQFKSPQWTIGKNFDATGAFGPEFVTADELPVGAKGLRLETRLNGDVVQAATTADMLFDVSDIVATVSEAVTLEPGDLLVMGTPAGVGFARKPPLFMKDGDMIEVEIEGVGLLRNPVKDEPARTV